MNTILEDLGAEIGFTATTALVAWFGNNNLYVPASVSEKHPIAKAIGVRAAERLVAAWGSETLWIPDGAQEERQRRDRLIADLLVKETPVKEIAAITGIHRRRVQQIAAHLHESGLLGFLVEGSQQKDGCEMPAANSDAKTQGKSPVGKPGAKVAGERPVGSEGADRASTPAANSSSRGAMSAESVRQRRKKEGRPNVLDAAPDLVAPPRMPVGHLRTRHAMLGEVEYAFARRPSDDA
jgi:hypothetical protein